MPDAALIAARKHAGDDSASRHAGCVAAEIAARPHAREVRHGVPARLARGAQGHDGRVGARPGPRWVPYEERAPPRAVTCLCEKARAAQVTLRRQRHTDEIEALAAVERKQARAVGV